MMLSGWIGRLWREAGTAVRFREAGTAVRFSASVMLLQGANLACNVLILAWLVPEQLGVWQTLLLVGTYVMILDGPAISGLNRELPFISGTGGGSRLAEMTAAGQRAAEFATVLCIVLIPLAVYLAPDADSEIAAGCVLAGCGARVFRQFLFVTYKAVQDFDHLAGFQAAEAVVSLVSLPVVAVWGLAGLGGRFTVTQLLICAVAYWKRPIRRPGSFSWKRLRELMVVGVPLFASSYLASVAKTLPRIILLAAGGVAWVGLFAPASAMIRGFSVLPASLAIYFYPRMSHQLGVTGDPRVVWRMVWKVTLLNLLIAVPGVVLAFFFVPPAIEHFFPAYVDAIPVVLIVVFSGFFVSSGITANALHSLKSWTWIIVSGVARLALFGGLPYLGDVVFGTLEGIAIGITAAFAGEFLVTLLAVRIAVDSGKTAGVAEAC